LRIESFIEKVYEKQNLADNLYLQQQLLQVEGNLISQQGTPSKAN
jgi:hypothetical protein